VRFAHSETITVRRPSGPAATGPRGDPLPYTTHTVTGCVFAPNVSTGENVSAENVYRRDTVSTGLALYAPPDADIIPIDRIVRADGTVWEVEGEPGDWQTPWTGWHPGKVVAVKRVTG
jgi:hypothetical protein